MESTVPSGHHAWPNCCAWSALSAGWRSTAPCQPPEALGRIRDAFHDYDQGGIGGP